MTVAVQYSKQFRSADEREWLVFGKFICITAERSGCNQYPLHGTLVLYRPKQVPNSGDAYGVRVTFRLDHNLAAADSLPLRPCSEMRDLEMRDRRCGTEMRDRRNNP
jgi:hypothetical protein